MAGQQNFKQRLAWVEMYHQIQNAGLVCRRCGISRPTLRKWVRRYQELGLEGLLDQNRRPKSCELKKVFEQQNQWILALRQTRKLGARRLQNELQRLHGLSLSTATIHKILKAAGVKPLSKTRRARWCFTSLRRLYLSKTLLFASLMRFVAGELRRKTDTVGEVMQLSNA